MPDEKPTLHVDTDWKKQAQEEKRRLAEQEKQRAAESSGATATAAAPQAAAPAGEGRRAREAAGGGAASRAPRELPPPSFAGLVQSIVTQILFHLGELSARGGEPVVNLDMAKYHIDTLGVLEEKTRGNLTDDERRMLDAALYETRMRYVSVASQYIS